MSDYVKATNFTAKDALPSGNSGKIIKGTEIDVELTAIAAAVASKADTNSPVFTGTPTAPTASSVTNNTQIATTAFVTTAVSASIPTGVIVMWSGSIATIPSGWALCNGSNGTPDLRNRFIVGAGSTYAVDGTGGSADAIVVAHTHTTSSEGSHNHTYTQTNNPSAEYAGTGVLRYLYYSASQQTTQNTSSAGAHTHTVNSTGSSGTNANLPPYYALAYIMKT